MPVTPANLVQGPAKLWWGVFGVTEPVDSNATLIADPGAGWTDLGGTTGGVSFEVDLTYTPQNVDQLIDPVGARLTKRDIKVTTKLAEATLANLNLAVNSLTSQSSGSGYATSDPLTTNSATQPTYTALIIDGWAPTLSSGSAARRRVIVRKTLSQTKVTMMYDMANMAVYEVTWTAYYVSSTIGPFHVIDQTS